MSFLVIAITIAIIAITFVMFLGVINIFNSTLIQGNMMSNIIIYFLLTAIMWFGLLPLTAAVYNHLAPRFGMMLINIRNAFFKITKSSNSEIIVSDLGERTELGNVNKVRRVILPLLLSIAVGFYSYNEFAPLLGYPQGFKTFGSTDFFNFMVGYMLLCTLPMNLSFIIFAFMIAGNYLLDDAGIVYYHESKRHRKPGDIEPISIWSQSFIKGIAGLSAIITFGLFFQTVNFADFFKVDEEGGGIMFFIFGIFIVISMFWGLPFLTSFSYMFLAIEVMDFTHEENCEKLYKKMEKKGYDTTPRQIVSLYPSGYTPSDKRKKTVEISQAKLEKKERKKETKGKKKESKKDKIEKAEKKKSK